MNEITFPLKPRMEGPEVPNLQEALQLLLERGLVLRRDEATRRELPSALQYEQSGQTCGEATRKLVSAFKEEQRLPASGQVDEPSANELNDPLDELGALDQPPELASTAYRADGKVLAALALRLEKDRHIRVFVTNRHDEHLYEYHWDGFGWKWENHGQPPGTTATDVKGATNYFQPSANLEHLSAEHIYAFVLGKNGHLYVRYFNGVSWLCHDQGVPAGTTVASGWA
jgi:hypothetical protein